MNKSYPIGEFDYKEPSKEERDAAIAEIANFPIALESYLEEANLQWENQYREGGWTAAEVLHHLADSHINAFCRMKLCLAEPGSSLRPYDEKEWNKLNSLDEENLHLSMLTLYGIHSKMAKMLSSCSEEQFQQTIFHPESEQHVSLNWFCMCYAWHGQHHLAHIKLAFGDL